MLRSRRFIGIVTAAFVALVVAVVASTSAVHAASFGESFVQGMVTSWPWYLTRACGLVAMVLMLLLMVSGIGLVTGYTYRFLEPLRAWIVHRALGIALIASVLVHALILLFDKYVSFNLAALFVPFVSNYEPTSIGSVYLGSINLAIGILSFYALVIVVVTSLVWIDKKPHAWKFVHYLSYLAMAGTFFHILFLGTDFKGGWLRTLWIIVGVVLLVGILMRLRRAGTFVRSNSKK